MLAKKNVSLAPYTTFKIGGLAKELWECACAEELLMVVDEQKKLKNEPVVIAGGSNILFGDKTKKAVIVYRRSKVTEGDIARKGNKVTVNAAIYLDSLVAWAAENGLGGLESLSWIPGTVAGATVGNAGAYGHSAGEYVDAVEIFDGKKRRWISKEECRFGYRDSIFKKKKWLILNVTFNFRKAKPSDLKIAREKVIADRRSKFYENIKCPGSFFKNVLASKVSKQALAKIDQNKIIDGKIPVGYLLDQVGARGMREGGIFVTDFHGNLILNDGAGTFKQVIKLTTKLKKLTKKRFGIDLEEEVRIVL